MPRRTKPELTRPRHELSNSDSFLADARQALGELSRGLAAIVDAAPNPIRRAVDLQRILKVDAPLAWRIFKVAMADDPLLAAPHVPTRGQFLTLLAAAERSGMRPEIVAKARTAIEDYEQFWREHTDDRTAFDAMIAALRPGAASQIDQKVRRAAFRQMAQIWGLQAQAAVRAMILHPGREPGLMGAAMVTGFIGLHAVRPEVPLVVHSSSRFKADVGTSGTEPHIYRTEDRSGLLLEFCSPGVEFRTDLGDDERLTTRMCAPGIGRRAAVNAFTLSVSAFSAEDANEVRLNHATHTPVELCHIDVLAPVGLTNPATARMSVYGRRSRVDHVYERRAADLLPIREAIIHIGERGGVEEVPPAAGIPRWPAVVRHVLDDVGAAGVRFDIYRCRMPYPVLHTLISLEVDGWAAAAATAR